MNDNIVTTKAIKEWQNKILKNSIQAATNRVNMSILTDKVRQLNYNTTCLSDENTSLKTDIKDYKERVAYLVNIKHNLLERIEKIPKWVLFLFGANG